MAQTFPNLSFVLSGCGTMESRFREIKRDFRECLREGRSKLNYCRVYRSGITLLPTSACPLRRAKRSTGSLLAKETFLFWDPLRSKRCHCQQIRISSFRKRGTAKQIRLSIVRENCQQRLQVAAIPARAKTFPQISTKESLETPEPVAVLLFLQCSRHCLLGCEGRPGHPGLISP
jgi:hypothetical protein